MLLPNNCRQTRRGAFLQRNMLHRLNEISVYPLSKTGRPFVKNDHSENIQNSWKTKKKVFQSSWKHWVFFFGFPVFTAGRAKGHVSKCFFTIVCTWGPVKLKDVNKRRTTEAQGPAPAREVGDLFSPEWCQIPSSGRARRGGGLCLWTVFFLAQGSKTWWSIVRPQIIWL